MACGMFPAVLQQGADNIFRGSMISSYTLQVVGGKPRNIYIEHTQTKSIDSWRFWTNLHNILCPEDTRTIVDRYLRDDFAKKMPSTCKLAYEDQSTKWSLKLSQLCSQE